MACITGQAIIGIPANSGMMTIHICFVMGMTVDAAEFTIIGCIRVAVCAKGPCTLVLAGIDREIFIIMIECSRLPCGCGMTGLAVGAKLGSSMRRIRSLVVIG